MASLIEHHNPKSSFNQEFGHPFITPTVFAVAVHQHDHSTTPRALVSGRQSVQ